MSERPERAIKWLEEKYESGPAQVTGVIQYILKLEAENAELKEEHPKCIVLPFNRDIKLELDTGLLFWSGENLGTIYGMIADSHLVDRLENAEFFSLTKLPQSGGKTLVKLMIHIHEDAAPYFPETGSMTVRELFDNEEKVFDVLEEQDHE